MYWTLFLTFVKIGTFTIGGGYAMLPLIQREVVDRGWLSKEDFIRYAVLALRDCFVADIRTEKDDTIVLYFVTGERFRLRVSK